MKVFDKMRLAGFFCHLFHKPVWFSWLQSLDVAGNQHELFEALRLGSRKWCQHKQICGPYLNWLKYILICLRQKYLSNRNDLYCTFCIFCILSSWSKLLWKDMMPIQTLQPSTHLVSGSNIDRYCLWMGLLLFAMITPNDFHICFRGNHEIVQPRSHSSLPSAPQSLGEEAG